MCCCSDVGFDDGDYLLEDSREDNIVSVQHTARRRMCVAHFTSQKTKMYDQQNPSCRQPRRAQAEPENEAASDSDLEAAPVSARGKRGRRSADLTSQKQPQSRAANATGHQQNLPVMLMRCLCCHLIRAKR